MSSEFAVIGTRQPRVDGFEKVSGRAQFTSDISLPGMLHLKILRSPYPHARIVSIDTSKALALPGVKAVLTYKDMPASRWNPQMPILTDVARFVGDDIAVVAAVSEEIAIEARELIKVNYQVLPFVLDPEEAMKPGAPKLFPEGNVVGGAPARVNRGNVERASPKLTSYTKARYRTPILQHATNESRVAVAQWEAGKLTLWDSTQAPFDVQKAVAKVMGIPMSKVRVSTEFLGGGFGDKGFPRTAERAGRHDGAQDRPARQGSNSTGKKSISPPCTVMPAIMDLKYGVKKDGTLTAIQAKVVADGGAYAMFGAAGLGIMECMMTIYRCPNMKGEAWTVSTNNPPTGPMRCVGHPREPSPRKFTWTSSPRSSAWIRWNSG